MARAVPFRFDLDFTERGPRGLDAGVSMEAHERALADAAEAGFARGQAAGRTLALEGEAKRLADAMTRIGTAMRQAFAAADARGGEREADAVALAVLLARKLGGAAIARHPLAEIEEAARACFVEARAAPHLVVRVAPALVEMVRTHLDELARGAGFAGRLAVIGEDDIAPGDARLEWADGGIRRDRQAVLAAVTAAVERHVGAALPDMGEAP